MQLFDRMSALRPISATVMAGLLLAASLLSAECAGATAEIEGSANDIVLRVKNAPIRDVLAALAVQFKLTYRAPPNLTRELSGRYSGSLNQVLARILDGTDYVVEASDEEIKLVILNLSGVSATADNKDNRTGNAHSPAAPPAAAPTSPAQAAAVEPASASRPPARQPAAMPGNVTSPAVPPLTTFLPTSLTALP